MAEWRRYFVAAVMTKDVGCLEMVIDEARKALDGRLEELGKLPECEESRKESVEILHAAKRLIMLRAGFTESEDSEDWI